MRHYLNTFFMLTFTLLTSTDVFAAAAMQRRLQQQKMQQEQMMQQAYQQAMAQKQAQEMAAYQQAMAQRQAVMQQQAMQQKAAMEYAAYKQAMQQAVAKRNAEMQAVQAMKQAVVQRQAEQVAYKQAVMQKQVQEVGMYKQAVAQKQVAEVVAYKQAVAQRQVAQERSQVEVNQQVREYAQYLAARKAALGEQAAMVQQAAVGQKVMHDAASQRAQVEQARRVAQGKVATEAVAKSALGQRLASEVMTAKAGSGSQLVGNGPMLAGDDTVVSIQDLWKALDRSSGPWRQIVDKEVKLLTVSEYLDRFKKLKVKIAKDPGHYVGLIDAFADQMPGFLDAPFMNVLSYAAIVEYDFESGTNKDDLARQVLGAGQFEANRKRVFGR
ncbi:MAG: hypothetical protein HQL17_00370 [Candidatus Omnitrophica bacterium]|nr:hypothetical protein [Candidatus Omnitrophota bacterium]